MPAMLLDITIVFVLAVVAAVVCHRLNVPLPIGLLVAGILAGPDALGLVSNVHQIELLAEIGVVLLLFVIGLEFSLADLFHLRRHFLVGGTIQFLGTAVVIAVVTRAVGPTLQQSVYIGFVVALSSTAIVLKMLQDRAELDAPYGRAVLAVLIFQDIAVVPVILVAPLLAGAGGSATSEVLALMVRIAAVGAFAFAAYRWVVPWVLGRICATRSSEAFLLGVLSLCAGIAMLTQSMGLSLALGAFLAGLIISESDYSHQAITVMLPFRDVFMSLFFVSIGMLLDLQFLLQHPLRIAALTLGVLMIKPLVAGAGTIALGLPLHAAVLAGFALSQVGEFSLVAAQAGVLAGLLGPEAFQTVLDTAVMSMLFTPLMFAIAPRVADVLQRTPLARLERSGFASARLSPAHEYSGHVIIVGFGLTGRNLASTARRADVPYAVIELNAETVKAALEDGEPIHYGDATQEAMLRHIDADKARAIAVVIDDPSGARRVVELTRRICPDAYVIVRTRYLREVNALLALGADEVVADELEVSVEVFSRVLARMLVPREDVERFIDRMRADFIVMSRPLAKDATNTTDLCVNIPDLATHSVRLGAHSPIVGRTISESRLREHHGVTIIAVDRAGESISNPTSALVLEPDDVLFVVSPLQWDTHTIA